MTFTRRGFLKSSGAALVASGLFGARAVAAPPVRPRYFIQLFLRGGFDAILTTDPKLRGQIDANVDLPYDESAIIDLGSHRIGPDFARLRDEFPAMAVLNAVDHGTVSHAAGLDNILHLKRSYPVRDELGTGIAGRLGNALASTPLDEVWMIAASTARPQFLPVRRSLVMQDYSPGSPTLVDQLWTAGKEDAALAARALDAEYARCKLRPRQDCTSLAAVRGVLDRMVGTDLPAPGTLTIPLDDPTNAEFAKGAAAIWCTLTRDISYLLQNEVTRTVFCAVPHAGFDTHQSNTPGQARCCLVFAEGFKLLMNTLRATKTKNGLSLAEQTGIVISSEVGRNPFMNSAQGKDHFPQHPVIFMGPGVRPGQYGSTDKTMAGLPISAETGKLGTARRLIEPNLDDVGATILRWFDVDPVNAGYTGRPLDFLFT
ncbi:MAG TPA: DUF1501 domain-containing protein [Kofleriaceae bacterium]|jgi:uncharacterized protein (DUF1501 family)